MRGPSFRTTVTLIAMITGSSCKPEPLSPTTQFRGKTASEFCVVFTELCPFKPKDVIVRAVTGCKGADCYEYRLSPGSYKAKLQDSDGVYFEAARQVHKPVAWGGDELWDGGVYVEEGGDSEGYFYNMFGQMERYPLPACPYSIQRCDLGEPAAAEAPLE